MSQNDRVMKYIIDFGSISSMEAFKDLGVTRLSARIYDLKQRGYKFRKTLEKGINRYGEKCHFERYALEQK